MKNPPLESTVMPQILPTWYVYYTVENTDVKQTQEWVRPILMAAKQHCAHVMLKRRPSAPSEPVTFLEVYQQISDEKALKSLLDSMLLSSPLNKNLKTPRRTEVFWDLVISDTDTSP